MPARTLLALGLPIVGGLNWGLVALGRFDLVAKLTGRGLSPSAGRAPLFVKLTDVRAAIV